MQRAHGWPGIELIESGVGWFLVPRSPLLAPAAGRRPSQGTSTSSVRPVTCTLGDAETVSPSIPCAAQATRGRVAAAPRARTLMPTAVMVLGACEQEYQEIRGMVYGFSSAAYSGAFDASRPGLIHGVHACQRVRVGSR